MLHALIAGFIIMVLLAEMTETGLRIVFTLIAIVVLAISVGFLYLLWHLAFVDGHVAYALLLLSFPIAVFALVGIFFGEHPGMSFLCLVISSGVFLGAAKSVLG